MTASTLTCEQIAQALGDGQEKKLGPNSYKTLCPAHKDLAPSLSVTYKEGKILFFCHAGCAQADVISALKALDLWPGKTETREKPQTSGHAHYNTRYKDWRPKSHAPPGTTYVEPPVFKGATRPTESWLYRTYDGHIAGKIFRTNMVGEDGLPKMSSNGRVQKMFFQTAWCSSKDGKLEGWYWRGLGEPRCLYNEHLMAKSDKPILIVEGEKSADAANRLFGERYLAITWPGGSPAVTKANWSRQIFKGRDITLWPDNDDVGHKAMAELAQILLGRCGVSSVKTVELPNTLPKGWDLADEAPAGVSIDGILQYNKVQITPIDTDIERLNREYAYILVGGQGAILHEERQTPSSLPKLSFISPAAFKEFFGNQIVMVGKQQVPLGNYWIKHQDRRTYRSLVFEPGRNITGTYNLWQGFSVEPDPTGDWSLFEEHVRDNIAGGNEEHYIWIMTWMARIIQKPWKKLDTSLVVTGKQGTGKTILGKILGKLIGPHYTLVDDPHSALSNFNAHMASTILLHIDEAFFAGDKRNVAKLKGMITSDTHRIEYKGKDSIEVKNLMNTLITSNDTKVINAASEERRFAVFVAKEGHIQDHGFFGKLMTQMKNGGYGGLLYALQNWDLTKADPTVVPKTTELQHQKMLSLNTVQQFWYDRLSLGQALMQPGHVVASKTQLENLINLGVPRAKHFYDPTKLTQADRNWPIFVVISELHKEYVEHIKAISANIRREAVTVFGEEMKKMWPGEYLRRLVQYNGKASTAYVLKPLSEHREAFALEVGKSSWSGVKSAIDSTPDPESRGDLFEEER